MPGPQSGGVGQEPVPVGGDHATRGRHQLTQLVERVQDLRIGKHGLADEHRHLAPGVEDLVGAYGGLPGRGGGVQVVVAGIAAELVLQRVDVVLGDQHDGRVRCGHGKSLGVGLSREHGRATRVSGPWWLCTQTRARILHGIQREPQVLRKTRGSDAPLDGSLGLNHDAHQYGARARPSPAAQ